MHNQNMDSDIEEGISEVPLRETRLILQRVYNRLTKEMSEPHLARDPRRLTALTGLNPEILSSIKKRKKVICFPSEIDRAYVHKEYVNRLEWSVPCTTQLFFACQSAISPHVDIADFRKMLFKMDYVWKTVPNRPSIILEKPEITYRRIKFLKSILPDLNPESFDNVYFIEECAIDDNLNVYDYLDDQFEENNSHVRLIFAVSSETIVFNFLSVHNEMSFKHWITTELLPTLQKPGVIVYTNADHHCEADPCVDLNLDSLRCEMTAWLDKNAVPYDSAMSKFELYTLIENCTDKDANRFVVDNIIKVHKHTPLRLPDELNKLSPAVYITEVLKMGLKKSVELRNIQLQVAEIMENFDYDHGLRSKPEILGQYFSQAFDAYKKTYESDLKVDDILDKLISNQNLRVLNDQGDSDLPSLSEDSD